jgi:hypothetical protein
MTGHMGFDQRDQAGAMATRGGTSVWGFYFKLCCALHISGTERVLVENCHATRMSAECFYSQGPARWKGREPKSYTKAITYLRCSVVDCARNAFNNNDMAENTSVLYCRIVDVGGCSWEGASRFVRFIGNYVRNAGTVAMGNIRSRDARLEELGSGQHIIADNVFESDIPYGKCAIRAQASANEVIIRNNLFINFNSSGVELSSSTGIRDMPASNGTVTGNIFDMTCIGQKPASRIAIDVSASDAIVSDNQVYVRGESDPLVTAIRLREPALNVGVHDNLIRNCGSGIVTGRCQGAVGEVLDPQTFLRLEGAAALPLERRQSHRYQGWTLVWTGAGAKPAVSIIDSFDPETLRFRLKVPRELKVGERFEVFPPAAGWNIHHNTITGCLKPVILNSYGSGTSFFRDNLVSRGGAAGVKQAIEVRGRFNFIGNDIAGFDEKESGALALYADPLGMVAQNLYRRNIFERCANVVMESQKGLWHTDRACGNVFVDCGGAPQQSAAASVQDRITPVVVVPPKRLALRAPKLSAPVAIDGDVSEWPWNDPSRVAALAQTPAGDPLPKPVGFACAGWDDTSLCLAIRISAPKGTKPGDGGWGHGDGVEVSFQSAEPKMPTPIFLFWGTADGKFTSGPYGGASSAQVEALQKTVSYSARSGKDEWTCEWRIPFAPTGFRPAPGRKLMFNFGAHHAADGSWSAWVGTGAQLYLVDKAGDLLLDK